MSRHKKSDPPVFAYGTEYEQKRKVLFAALELIMHPQTEPKPEPPRRCCITATIDQKGKVREIKISRDEPEEPNYKLLRMIKKHGGGYLVQHFGCILDDIGDRNPKRNTMQTDGKDEDICQNGRFGAKEDLRQRKIEKRQLDDTFKILDFK